MNTNPDTPDWHTVSLGRQRIAADSHYSHNGSTGASWAMISIDN